MGSHGCIDDESNGIAAISSSDSRPSPASSLQKISSDLKQNLDIDNQDQLAELLENEDLQLFRAQSTGSEFTIDKENDVFRKDYIEKLANLKIIRPQTTKPHQTVVVFDWDDTLFPTSFLLYTGFKNEPSDSKFPSSLGKLDAVVSRLLLKALRAGTAYIITNSQKNWVQYTSEMYLPLTHELIKSNKINVVSARAEYEEIYPNDPQRWKLEAFKDLKETLQSSVLANIICIGDSTSEIEAANYLSRNFNKTIVKTVKMKERPRLEELAKQLEVLLGKFDRIYTTLRSLSIRLEKKNN